MRAITIGKTNTFKALEVLAAVQNEKNDCGVKALALAARVPYTKAKETLEALNGRDENGGTNNLKLLEALNKLGYEVEKIKKSFFIDAYPLPHCNALKNVTTHHPERFQDVWKDGKTYLLFSKGHVSAVVDGELHDWARGKMLRVTEILEVKPVKKGCAFPKNSGLKQDDELLSAVVCSEDPELKALEEAQKLAKEAQAKADELAVKAKQKIEQKKREDEERQRKERLENELKLKNSLLNKAVEAAKAEGIPLVLGEKSERAAIIGDGIWFTVNIEDETVTITRWQSRRTGHYVIVVDNNINKRRYKMSNKGKFNEETFRKGVKELYDAAVARSARFNTEEQQARAAEQLAKEVNDATGTSIAKSYRSWNNHAGRYTTQYPSVGKVFLDIAGQQFTPEQAKAIIELVKSF